MVNVITPSLVACEYWYNMSSTPLIACSNGEATVSAITVGFAPGYVARTTMVGGTTWGYSLMGRPGSAMSPTNRMSADNIAAKIGRSMKNRDIFICKSQQLQNISQVISGAPYGCAAALPAVG